MARLRLMTSSGLRSAQCPTAWKKQNYVIELGRDVLEQLEALAQELLVQLLGHVELGSQTYHDDADHAGHDRRQRGNTQLRVFQPFHFAWHRFPSCRSSERRRL